MHEHQWLSELPLKRPNQYIIPNLADAVEGIDNDPCKDLVEIEDIRGESR